MSAPDPGSEEPLPIRDFYPLPHQCRCIVFQRDDPELKDRCAELVYEGPDVPLCLNCQEKHWFPGSEKTLPLGRRLAGLEPH